MNDDSNPEWGIGAEWPAPIDLSAAARLEGAARFRADEELLRGAQAGTRLVRGIDGAGRFAVILIPPLVAG